MHLTFCRHDFQLHIALIAFLFACMAAFIPAQAQVQFSQSGTFTMDRFSPLSVVDDSDEIWTCFQSGRDIDWRNCMRSFGARNEAIAFSEVLDQKRYQGILTGYALRGDVDIGQVFLPMLANTNEQYVLLNGRDRIVFLHEITPRQPPSDSASRAFRNRFPNAMMSGRFFPAGYRDLPGGVQRFVFTDILTDGCRACEIVGSAIVHYDFRGGVLQNVNIVGWLPWKDDNVRPSADFALSREVASRIVGGDVREVQAQLNLKGFHAGAIDGAYGPQTRNALSEFLAENCQPGVDNFTPEGLNLLSLQLADVEMTADSDAHPGVNLLMSALDSLYITLQTCGPPKATYEVYHPQLAARFMADQGAGAPVESAADTSGLAATFPLRDGVYAREARYCRLEDFDAFDYGDGVGSVRRIFEDGVMHYYEAECRVETAVESNGSVRVRYSCSSEGYSDPRDAVFENVSETGFTEVYENPPFLHEAADFFYSDIRGNVGYQTFRHCDALVREDDPVETGDAETVAQVSPDAGPVGQADNEPVSLQSLQVEYAFLDPRHVEIEGKHLLGVSLRADPGTAIRSPIAGMIVGNRTGPAVDITDKWLVVRDPSTGREHIFGHIVSELEPGQTINAGDLIGAVGSGNNGGKLHWGINRYGIFQAVDTASGWGWGYGPSGAGSAEIGGRGWLDPEGIRTITPNSGESVESRDVASDRPEADENIPWYQRLVQGGRISGYRHGQFPSWGDRTHPGVDIAGPVVGEGCDLPVMAAEDGEVAGVLNYRDGSMDTLGNAILLRHAPEAGRPVMTLYLHLKNRPSLSVGTPVVAGHEIGRVGNTGTGVGCHLHFEVRHFEGWLYSGWGNIYGSGDWSSRPEFLREWSDPEAWFARTKPSLSLDEALERAVAILMGDPYGRNAEEVRNHISDVRFGSHEICTGETAWIFDVHVPNPVSMPGQQIDGYLVLEDSTGDLRCAGLPFLP